MLGKSGETGFQGLEKPARSPRKARRGGRVLATKATKRTKKRKKEAEGAREGTLTRRRGGKRDNGLRLAGDGSPHPTPQLPNHPTRNGQTNRKRAGGENGKRGKNGWARKRKIRLKMGLARDRVGASYTSGKLGGRDNNIVICNRKSFVRKKSSKFLQDEGCEGAARRTSLPVSCSALLEPLARIGGEVSFCPGGADPEWSKGHGDKTWTTKRKKNLRPLRA